MRKGIRFCILPICFVVCISGFIRLHGQDCVFFQDSPDQGFYDSGLAFFSSPSLIKQTNGDKIPTSASIVNEGRNSLEISWRSVPGGDWSALVIAPGFISQDISLKDTLFFFAFSPEEISPEELPFIFMEGEPGVTKSRKYDLADFIKDGVPESKWIQVKIPLKVFFEDPNQTSIDFQKAKAIILGQKDADGKDHSLFIDYVIATNENLSGTAEVPSGLTARGYERHVEVRWRKTNSGTKSVTEVYRSNSEEGTFVKIGETRDTLLLDFTGELGRNTSFYYKIRSRKPTGAESGFSEITAATTKDMSDDEFLDMVQEYTFRYFWEFAHPTSGLAYERNTAVGKEIVTSGGSGFGIMSIPVAINRGFISRNEGVDRVLKIVHFLEDADRFHGAWPHWLNGSTGEVIPFFREDNGGDLVETSFLIQGLLTAKEYFDNEDEKEREIREVVTRLWEGVEWDWYRQGPENTSLTWHWSPDFEWQINLALTGWNEVLMAYVLGISSPTHPIPSSLYDSGWARNGQFVSGRSLFGLDLPLGRGNGGPLFFTHYSFLGLDPRKFGDKYVDTYFDQGVAQTIINRNYCIENPGNYVGYSDQCWGLTASDNPDGYLAHEPNRERDNGTITPTAALSSIPYTPAESIAALKHFYREFGEQLWGPMGFYDAFNLSRNWFASSYLAIDQGPILLMIENYRTGLLWNSFMKHPDVKNGLQKLSRSTEPTLGLLDSERSVIIYPNPSSSMVTVIVPKGSRISSLRSLEGKLVQYTVLKKNSAEDSESIQLRIASAGSYIIDVIVGNEIISGKVVLK